MKLFFFGILLLPLSGIAQNDIDSLFPGVDSLYREDQIYLGFTYNILSGKPESISQSGFSGGFHIGFIRDFPLNDRRNITLGAGLGWSINTYGQNLLITEVPETQETVFRVLQEDKNNRFTTQAVTLPLQFRWRTSTAEKYKFWRIYTGLELGYVYYFRSTYVENDIKYRQTKVPEFNNFRMGATFTFGYNTFNFHIYYSLLPFFNDKAKVNNEVIGLTTFKVGLVFYLL